MRAGGAVLARYVDHTDKDRADSEQIVLEGESDESSKQRIDQNDATRYYARQPADYPPEPLLVLLVDDAVHHVEGPPDQPEGRHHLHQQHGGHTGLEDQIDSQNNRGDTPHQEQPPVLTRLLDIGTHNCCHLVYPPPRIETSHRLERRSAANMPG